MNRFQKLKSSLNIFYLILVLSFSCSILNSIYQINNFDNYKQTTSLKEFDDIDKLKKPSKVPSKGLMCDLLWSDPARNNSTVVGNTEVDEDGWGENDRGTSYVFNEKVVSNFVK